MAKVVNKIQQLVKRKAVISEYFANGFDAAKAWQSAYPNATRLAAQKSFSMLIADKDMQEYIAKLSQALDIKNGLRQAHIVESLLTVYSDAIKGDPILYQGHTTGHYKKDRGAALKALELLGKHLGMFMDTHQHLTINYNNVEVEFVD